MVNRTLTDIPADMKWMANEFQSGKLLLVDKPLEWTSFDVVNKIRYMIKRMYGLKKIKVGHAGTLDPLATGLLIICTGRFTKKLQEFQDLEKEYTGTMTLGATTPSFDLETAPDRLFDTSGLNEEAVRNAANTLTGALEQEPPAYSAKRVNGVKAYEMIRKGEAVELGKNKVNVSAFDIPRIQFPEVDFRIVCSKGTYIRSLARDLGESLNNGAHLSRLRRERIGKYSANDAIKITDLENALMPDRVRKD